MRRSLFVLYGLFLVSATCLAVSISGTVVGNKKQALPEIVVELTGAENLQLIHVAQTDSKGCFRFDYVGKSDSLKIRIIGFNIEKKSVTIPTRSQNLNIQVVEKEVRIKDVVIHTKQIWRSKDTVNYLVSRFTRYNDQTIGDIIRKLPWLTLEENGAIRYLDKPIHRFCIEELELPKDRFGLAATLLKPQDVYIIQVFKKRSFKKKRRNFEIAINLKVK